MSAARLVTGSLPVLLALALTAPLAAQDPVPPDSAGADLQPAFCEMAGPVEPATQQCFDVAVTPDGPSTPTRTAYTGGYTASFTVKNTGIDADYYSLSCSGSANTTCTGVSPTNVVLGSGGSAAVTAYYDVGGPGTGTVTLHASGSAYDTGYWRVPVVSYGVSVTPDGGTAVTRMAHTGGHAESFTVHNTGSGSNTFSFTCSGAGGVTCGAVPAPVTLAGGGQTTVSQGYGVGAAGTGTLTLTATGTNASDPGSYSVPVDGAPPDVRKLLPAGDVYVEYPTIQLAWCDDHALNAGSRWIKVNGVDRTGSFDYAPGSGPSDCTVKATSTSSSVALVVGANSVEGRICDGVGHCTTKTFWITRIAANAPVPAFLNHNRDHHARALCLTAAAGDAAQVQCGDLVAYHGMPAFRSLNRARALTLVYNSATAEPRPRVAANVQVQSTVAKPQSIYAELTVSGVRRASASYAAWDPGQTRQIVLAFDASGSEFPTGLYPFSLMTRSVYPDATYDATISDTLIVVNREGSAFGAGWYLAGVEQLVLSPLPERILWVGGDGSARVYRTVGPDEWQAPAGAYRDRLVRLGDGTYERRGQHGVTVRFDAQGRHVETRNRLGHVTKFVWADGQLIEITVPGTGGG